MFHLIVWSGVGSKKLSLNSWAVFQIMLFRLIKLLFCSLVFKDIFNIFISMDVAMQFKRINTALEETYFDMYTRSRGILSEIQLSFLDLSCMSQLLMSSLCRDPYFSRHVF